MRLRLHRAPKYADAPDEYEDAHWPEVAPDPPELPLRLAVADGATTSSFSGLWARILVQAWGEGRLDRETLTDDVCTLSRQWRASVETRDLPWFAREKTRFGAHAALLGVTVEPGGRFEALAVGDCCLFQVREGVLIEAFPARHPEALDGHPYLIGTDASEALDEAARTALGWWEPGDTLFAMSDALARWFLECALVREQRPWEWLARLGTRPAPKAFEAMLRPLRADGRLQRDDVTLAILDL